MRESRGWWRRRQGYGRRRWGRVINYKALEGRRRPTTGGCAARRMCKGMIMPNGEILPTGPGITWTRARPCSNLFDRVSYFSARPWKKIICPSCDATRCPPVVVVRKSCLQVAPGGGGGRENGSREKHGWPNGARHARATFVVYLEISSTHPLPGLVRPAHFGSSRWGC